MKKIDKCLLCDNQPSNEGYGEHCKICDVSYFVYTDDYTIYFITNKSAYRFCAFITNSSLELINYNNQINNRYSTIELPSYAFDKKFYKFENLTKEELQNIMKFAEKCEKMKEFI